MSGAKVTPMQEAAIHNFLKTRNKTAAYKSAYSWKNMKPQTLWRKAHGLFELDNVKARLAELQREVTNRSLLSITKITEMMSEMAQFDPKDFYDDEGNILPISEMPFANRLMLQHIESFEEHSGTGEKRIVTGKTRKLRTLDRNDTLDKLLRILGGYATDNMQKNPIINNNVMDMTKLDTATLLKLKEAFKKDTPKEGDGGA